MITRTLKGYRCGECHQRARATDATVKRARELREQRGLSYARISRVLGYSKHSIRDWCEYRTRINA